MARRVYCDICERECSAGFETLTGGLTPVTHDGELHICKPRHGGDVGCFGFFFAGLRAAQEQAHEWVEGHRGSGPAA